MERIMHLFKEIISIEIQGPEKENQLAIIS